MILNESDRLAAAKAVAPDELYLVVYVDVTGKVHTNILADISKVDPTLVTAIFKYTLSIN